MASYRLQLDVWLADDAPTQELAALLPVAPSGGRLTLDCTVHGELMDIAVLLEAVESWVRMPDSQRVGSLENLDDARQLIEDIIFSDQSLLLIAPWPDPDDLYNYYR